MAERTIIIRPSILVYALRYRRNPSCSDRLSTPKRADLFEHAPKDELAGISHPGIQLRGIYGGLGTSPRYWPGFAWPRPPSHFPSHDGHPSPPAPTLTPP